MATLTAIRKQIKRLEAEAERITRQEMSGAIAKIRSLMSDFGITLEHLGVTGKTRGAKRSVPKKAAPKRAGASRVRYADPKTGKTWSGFGRAPAWIAGEKNRDAFLVGAELGEPVKPKPAKGARKAAVAATPTATAKKSSKAAKKAPSKRAATGKKTSAAKKTAAAKKVSVGKATVKVAASKKSTKSKPPKAISGEGNGEAATDN